MRIEPNQSQTVRLMHRFAVDLRGSDAAEPIKGKPSLLHTTQYVGVSEVPWNSELCQINNAIEKLAVNGYE